MEQRYFMLNINFQTPIVMNKPGFKIPDDITEPKAKVQYEHDHFKEKLHMNGAGKPFIPALAIHVTLKNSVRLAVTKPPKGFKSWIKFVADCLLVIDDAVIECNEKQIVPWHSYVGQQGRIGRRVMIETVRPMILLPASAGAKLLVIDDRLTTEFLDELIDIAGRITAFMSARPLHHGKAIVSLQPISKDALD